MQDQKLIKRIKKDDESAFKELIDKYKQQAFAISMGFMHNKAQAEDIVQDVFVKFWEIKDEFELKAKFSTWLYRVVSNMSINQLRRNKFSSVFSAFKNSENNLNSTDYEQQIIDNNTSTVDENFKDEHIKIALKKAINSLPKRQRIAFIFSKYQNFSYKEIAEIMETSVSSVESLLHRAKNSLQKKLVKTYKSINKT